MPSEIGITEDEIVERYAEGLNVQFVKSSRQRPDTDGQDRRRQLREEFDCTRMIASWDGETQLSESDFQPTLCRDLSANGLAFWIDERPSTEHVVVQVDVNEEIVYLKARVAHTTPEFDSERPSFLVGCEFMGKLDLDLNF